MSERRIWQVVIVTMMVTGLVLVALTWDPDFLSGFHSGSVIPVSTGQRVEILMGRISPLQGRGSTDLYWLEKDGAFEKVRSFEESAQCVTAVGGNVFITFADGSSIILADAGTLRGVAGPVGFKIFDVAPLDGKVCALGLTGGSKGRFGVGTRLHAALLDEGGWRQDAKPFTPDGEIFFAGSIGVEGGVEVVFATGPSSITGGPKMEKVAWHRVRFDGASWSDQEPLEVPEGVIPLLVAYEGSPAFFLIPFDGEDEIGFAVLEGNVVHAVAKIAQPDEGRIVSAWLVELDGEYRAILVGGRSVWEVPMTGGSSFGRPRRIMQISAASVRRGYVYIGILLLAAVFLVSAGITWFAIRIALIAKRPKDK